MESFEGQFIVASVKLHINHYHHYNHHPHHHNGAESPGKASFATEKSGE